MDSNRHRHRQRLSLDLLKGFDAAARHLSFTRAAEELSLTQSAISREIKSLEEQIGQALFVRIHRGLRLTDAGQMLHRAVGEALNLIDEVTGRLAAAHSTETLTVTTSAPLASTWLVPKLPSFFRLRPEVDVRCVSVDHKLDLERERLDLAIRWAPAGSSVPGGERLFGVQRFPVCAPGLAHDPKRPLRKPADLARHVLLDLQTTTDQGLWSDWTPWLNAMKLGSLKPAGAMRFSHYDQVVQAAIDGSGVAIGRYPHNARHLSDGLLVAPLGPEATLGWGSYFVLMTPRAGQRRVVQDFVAWLRETVRQDEEAMRQQTPARVAEATPRAGRSRLR
jgi:LysR family transcriptional regulator, glycine cleavage system transcriptional activator